MKDTEKLLGVPETPVDTERGLARIRERVERERIRPVTREVTGMPRPLVSIWAKGLAAAASVALIAVLFTASGLAGSILTIFEPKQVAAVPITQTDIATAIDSLGSFGTLEWSTQPKPYAVPDLASAARESGLVVLTPSQLPAGVSVATARYGVMSKTTATFTFSAQKTQESAARQGRTPPPMPANIDGSKLFITGGPAVVQIFLDGTQAPAPSGDPFSQLPKLVIAEGRAPVVQSDGVTADQLLQYLLTQPGITPQLAAQIKAIKDPSTTLPIPIPIDMASSKTVTVQGVQGVFVGDSTGLGSALIWQKDGLVYGVAGTLSEAQIMAVANSLH